MMISFVWQFAFQSFFWRYNPFVVCVGYLPLLLLCFSGERAVDDYASFGGALRANMWSRSMISAFCPCCPLFSHDFFLW